MVFSAATISVVAAIVSTGNRMDDDDDDDDFSCKFAPGKDKHVFVIVI